MATLVYEDFPGTTTEYKVNFEYLEQSDVKVGSISDEEILTPITTGWSWKDETTIEFDSAPGGTIRIYRVTNVDEPIATFYPTVAIRAVDLNNNFDQCLFRLQELDTGVGDINADLEGIQEEINNINEILLDLSGIEIVPDVAALNAYNPPDDSVGTAIQVSNSSGWSGANNVTGTPAGFAGGTDIRVNVRVTNDTTPTYAFMNYLSADPDGRYVMKSGDTMTGPLTLSGAPSTGNQAATKAYVDAAVAGGPDGNTTYDFGAATNGSNTQLQLVGSDGSTDVVTIVPGTNVTFSNQSATGFTINASGGGGGTNSTNLSWTAVTTETGQVSSDTGTNATLTAATINAAGLMSASDKTKLNNAATTSDLSNYLTTTDADARYIKADWSTYQLLP